MAAYAALVSVLHIIDQIQHHPNPPISLDQNTVESLTANIIFLQEFLERYSDVEGYSKEADPLETRIADAAYAAEDVIESYIVDQIESRFTKDPEKISSETDFNKSLQEVIGEMDSIKKEVMEITKEKMGVPYQLHKYLSVSASSSTTPSIRHNPTMVGFDDALNELMDKLTGLQYNLQKIPIVGMGGTGKTTLARNIYANALVVEHFDILAWVTISQVYSMREILLQLLLCIGKWSTKDLSEKSEDELGVILYKYLSGRRYLIVMDDIWSIEAWDKVKFFFPDNSNGSRIMTTTRLLNLAFLLSDSYNFHMKFLDEDNSWNLFCQIVFGKEDCPVELEELGKKIVKNCKGLPLSIVVIGGILTKYKGFIQYWEYTLENLYSTISLEDDERCLKILYMSYKELPMNVKPCFLYMGVFQEDREIHVPELIKLWVAEGILKPINGKSLEVVAAECFHELIVRNLVTVHKLGTIGKTKFCKVHDLLRDLSLKEAQKQKFLCVTRLRDLYGLQHIKTERRIVIHGSTPREIFDPLRLYNYLQSASHVRSLIVEHQSYDFDRVLQSANLRLLRVFKVNHERGFYGYLRLGYKLYNLRYFSSNRICNPVSLSPRLCWNLQTLVDRDAYDFSEFWEMPLLRHVHELTILSIPNPPIDRRDVFVFGNLQTLSQIRLSACRAEVFERIPNINKLKIRCEEDDRQSLHFLNNLSLLHKLEHLNCIFLLMQEPIRSVLLQNLTFPRSLKKLTLCGCLLNWEDITAKIGPLPLLEVLKLKTHSFVGPEWETVEGQFWSLKFLLINRCFSLQHWTTESTHFPCLEHLVLGELPELKEIPFDIGEIPTLQSIKLKYCSDAAVISAKRIWEEQVELGNEGLQVDIIGSRAGGGDGSSDGENDDND